VTTDLPVPVCAVGATAPCSSQNGNLLSGVTAIASGRAYNLALLSTGEVAAWGANDAEQLGAYPPSGPELCIYASQGCSLTPLLVCASLLPCPSGPYFNEVIAVAAGYNTNVALTTEPPPPHWYSNGTLISGPAVTVKSKGKLTLHAQGGALEIRCNAKDLETVANPVGGGAGTNEMTEFVLTGCKALAGSVCGTGEKLEVDTDPPWSSELLQGRPAGCGSVGPRVASSRLWIRHPSQPHQDARNRAGGGHKPD
jgi:hypothetical protein